MIDSSRVGGVVLFPLAPCYAFKRKQAAWNLLIYALINMDIYISKAWNMM